MNVFFIPMAMMACLFFVMFAGAFVFIVYKLVTGAARGNWGRRMGPHGWSHYDVNDPNGLHRRQDVERNHLHGQHQQESHLSPDMGHQGHGHHHHHHHGHTHHQDMTPPPAPSFDAGSSHHGGGHHH